MIEIIERGPDLSERQYTATCGYCESKLRFLGADASAGWDRNEPMLQIDCPVCKMLVEVPTSKSVSR